MRKLTIAGWKQCVAPLIVVLSLAVLAKILIGDLSFFN